MTAPLCRYCAKPIAKRVRTVWLHARPLEYYETGPLSQKHLAVPELPRTKADCQKLTNWTVVSVTRDINPEFISRFGEWDGESYIDLYFCNGDHARRFGYAAAHSGQAMPAYNKAMALKKGAA